jgi:predicted nucleic acid-binding protein
VPSYVVDTNLYVEAIRTDQGNRALAAFQRRFAPFLYQHSTVVQEILAGARTEADHRRYLADWVAPFEDLGRIITPSHAAWKRAALIITRLVATGALSPGGFRRSFLNDCLVAASAREEGFILVTRDAADFGLIREVEPGCRYELPWPER